jgi:hypothetical protein
MNIYEYGTSYTLGIVPLPTRPKTIFVNKETNVTDYSFKPREMVFPYFVSLPLLNKKTTAFLKGLGF